VSTETAHNVAVTSSLSNGSIRQFDGVGHGGPVQVPSLLAEAVLDFVDAVPV